MPARFRDRYTPDEDAAILTADGAGIKALAERWGRSRGAINSRKSKLRRSKAVPKMSLAQLAPALSHHPRSLGPNFARPAFFESEDLGKIALARR